MYSWRWARYLHLGFVAALVLVYFVQPPSEWPPGTLVVLVYVAAISFSGILILGLLLPDIEYPYSRHRERAFFLWVLVSVPAFLNGLYFSRWGSSLVAAIATYILTFVLFTLFTLGDLPLYGGAGKEGVELQRRLEILSRNGNFGGRTFRRVEACGTCLTGLVDEDQHCWRCNAPVREGAPVKDWLGRPMVYRVRH